jgi:hypothetical protein
MYCITLCIHLVLSPFSGLPHQDRTKACRSTYKDTATRIRVREPPVAGGAAGGRGRDGGPWPGRSSGEATHCGTAPAHAAFVRARLQQARGGADRRRGRHVGSPPATELGRVSCRVSSALRTRWASAPTRPALTRAQCNALELQNRGRCKPACPHLLHRINLADASCLGGWGKERKPFFSRVSVALRHTDERKDVDRRRTIWRARCQLPTPATNSSSAQQPTPAVLVLAPYPYPKEWQPWIRRSAWRVFSNRLRIYTSHVDCDSWVPRAPASACSLVRRGERKREKGECRYTTCFLGRRIRSLLDWWIVCYAVQKTRYGAACRVCWSWSKPTDMRWAGLEDWLRRTSERLVFPLAYVRFTRGRRSRCSATGRGVVPVCYMNKPGPTSQCPRGRW